MVFSVRNELPGDRGVQELYQESGNKYQSSKTHSQPARVQQKLHCKLKLLVWLHEASPHPQLFLGQ